MYVSYTPCGMNWSVMPILHTCIHGMVKCALSLHQIYPKYRMVTERQQAEVDCTSVLQKSKGRAGEEFWQDRGYRSSGPRLP